jgi:hypothetical protein
MTETRLGLYSERVFSFCRYRAKMSILVIPEKGAFVEDLAAIFGGFSY